MILSVFIAVIAVTFVALLLEYSDDIFDLTLAINRKSRKLGIQQILAKCSKDVFVGQCPNKDYIVVSSIDLSMDEAYTADGYEIYRHDHLGGFEPTVIYVLRKLQGKRIGCLQKLVQNLCQER